MWWNFGRHVSLRDSWAKALASSSLVIRTPLNVSIVQMAKLLVDAPASGVGEETHAGSTPALDTKLYRNCGDRKAFDQFYARRQKGKVSRRSECIVWHAVRDMAVPCARHA